MHRGHSIMGLCPLVEELSCLSMAKELLPPESWFVQMSVTCLQCGSKFFSGFCRLVMIILLLVLLFLFFFSTLPDTGITKYFSSYPMTSPLVACWVQTRCVLQIGLTLQFNQDGPVMKCTSCHLHQDSIIKEFSCTVRSFLIEGISLGTLLLEDNPCIFFEIQSWDP